MFDEWIESHGNDNANANQSQPACNFRDLPEITYAFFQDELLNHLIGPYF
jgi:hypothetical protein